MDTNVTNRRVVRFLAGCALLCEIALGQNSPQNLPVSQAARDTAAWRKLGNDSVGLNLAGPAGGPVDAVWFAPAGERLFVRTRSGQILETADFANWTVSRSPSIVSPLPEIGLSSNVRSPESGARILMGGGRLYSLGNNLEVSYDFGSTWSNLTGFDGEPVIGSHQHGVAISPLDPRQIVVANDFGVWRTADGGLSWSGLNEELPNLPMRHLLPSAVP